MVVILLALGMFFSVVGSESFSDEQRDEARVFIGTCFDQIRQIQRRKQEKLSTKIERLRKDVNTVLSAKQIDYRAYKKLEDSIDIADLKSLDEAEYEISLSRPRDKIVVWDEVRESQALAIQAYVSLSDEWQQYKNDPLNLQKYEQLHKRMTSAVRMVVHKSDYMLVSGTHARPYDSDDGMNYDADRVFFLTLFLLNKKFLAGRDSAASSSA